MIEKKTEYSDIRQIGFILTLNTLNKLKDIKTFHKCKNQSITLTKIIYEEYDRINNKVIL